MNVFNLSQLGPDYDTQYLRSLGEFQEWGIYKPAFFSLQTCKNIADHALRNGIVGNFLGRVGADEVGCSGTNYREDLTARDLNSRQRAILDIIATLPGANWPHDLRIYASEAVTPLALALRGRYSKFIGSEFAANKMEADELLPIVPQDLMQLSYPSDLFHLSVCNEVFEHIPDLEKAFSEIHRTLRSSGVLLATFPFLPGQENSIVKARVTKGQIEHIVDPEFHGDPQRPSEGSLVYRVPAWDVVRLAENAGFDAGMLTVSSLRAGITGSDAAGIYVLSAIKR